MILAAATVGAAASPGSADAASITPLRVGVLLSNQAGLAPEVVEGGKAIAERIYRKVGIELVWFGGRELAWKLPLDREARSTFLQSTLKVLLVARRQLPIDALAEAVPRARTAWVSMGRLDAEVARERWRVSRSDVLGHVLAHEIGHLLGQDHCAPGVMAARLDWERVSRGGLWFGGRQAARLRERLDADASLAPPVPVPAPDVAVSRVKDIALPQVTRGVTRGERRAAATVTGR